MAGKVRYGFLYGKKVPEVPSWRRRLLSKRVGRPTMATLTRWRYEAIFRAAQKGGVACGLCKRVIKGHRAWLYLQPPSPPTRIPRNKQLKRRLCRLCWFELREHIADLEWRLMRDDLVPEEVGPPLRVPLPELS